MLEVRVLKMLNHKNIVKFIGEKWTDTRAYLVMERAAGVPLSDFLKLNEVSDATSFSIKLLSAVAYLHSQGVVHRDLKPSNLIVTGETLMLIDFNTAVSDVKGYSDCIVGGTGLKEWSAPETRQKLCYSAKSDSYSIGLIIALLKPESKSV